MDERATLVRLKNIDVGLVRKSETRYVVEIENEVGKALGTTDVILSLTDMAISLCEQSGISADDIWKLTKGLRRAGKTPSRDINAK